MRFVCLPTTLILIGLMIVSPGANSETGMAGMKFSDFRTRSRDDEQGMSWELAGEEAEYRETMIEIAGLHLQLKSEEGITDITSPTCTLDRSNNIGRSPATVRAVGENMTMQGRGYHFLLNQHRLYLHSEVTMVIRHRETSLFPEPQVGADE